MSLVTQGLGSSGLMTQGYGGLISIVEAFIPCDETALNIATDLTNAFCFSVAGVLSFLDRTIEYCKTQFNLEATDLTDDGIKSNITDDLELDILGDKNRNNLGLTSTDLTDDYCNEDLTSD